RPPVEVRFYARGFHTGMGWGDLAGLVVYPDGSHSIEAWPGQTGKEDLVTGVESIWVRVGIPLAVLGNPESAMINVETRVEGVLVDRTAWRPVSLDER
ncbi:MAG TPA: hypothetical protein VK464_17765, partial [Symbiobacteriaceae bacterium]|nr:hypothetical protein [Symbiobacteriaceae bacterium]